MMMQMLKQSPNVVAKDTMGQYLGNRREIFLATLTGGNSPHLESSLMGSSHYS